MLEEKLQKVKEFNKDSLVFVASTSKEGCPHIALAESLKLIDNNNVAVKAWFCPSTLANLEGNKLISLIIWNKDNNTGLQIIGKAVKEENIAFLDGYAPKIENKSTLPQEEIRLIIQVEKVLEFIRGNHNDK